MPVVRFSKLSLELLRSYALGILAATQLQVLAAAAWADGWGRDQLDERLARAGVDGKYKNNIARDIRVAVQATGLMKQHARPYFAEVAGPDGHPIRLTCYLPHEVFAIDAETCGLEPWCLSEAELNATKGLGPLLQAWGEHSDVVGAGNVRLSEVAVFGFHCDAVQYTSSMRAGGARSVVVGSFNIISAQEQNRRAKRNLFFVLSKQKLCNCGCSGYHTFQGIWEILAWSMQHLLKGRAPAARHDGMPWTAEDQQHRLARGTPLPRAALLQLRGDWEWMVQCFRFRSFSSGSFCWMCNAAKEGPLSFRDFRPQAAHRSTLVSHEAYLEHCAEHRVPPSNIFRCPGTVLSHAAVDSMHTCDLGVFPDVLGALFWLEISNKQWHRNSKAGLVFLNQDIEAFYAANHERKLAQATPLSASQIRSAEPGYPTLKTKAAQTRHLAEYGLLLAQRHRFGDHGRPAHRFRAASRLGPHSAEHARLLCECLEGMVDYHRSCVAEPFPPDDCKAAMYKFLAALLRLHDLWRRDVPADQQRGLPFVLRPKAHMCQHLVEDHLLQWGSPRMFWCYGDEDFVGHIKDIAAKTKAPTTLEERVAEKVSLLVGIEAYEQANP